MSLQSQMKRNALLFLSAIVVSSAISYQSVSFWIEKDKEMKAARKALRAAQTEYDNAKNNSRILSEFNTRFKLMDKRNVFNEEDRLNWAEKIESTANRFHIPRIEYSIEHQMLIKDAGLKKAFPGIQVARSRMKLSMRLLHEGDLYNFFNTLDNEAKGLFDIEQCNIERKKQLGASLLDQKDLNNLNASCVLNWYSIKTKGA
ncbi:MAG: hypothetical protein OEY43_05915 [Gammaproteobacteria bacterium]|nr:hypothetical protein [Gammaproteobacteria bacterium]